MNTPLRNYQEFQPRTYLEEYYQTISVETLALLQFLVYAFRQVPPNSTILELGCGPTLYTALAASARAGEIHLSDYLAPNLAEIQRWLIEHPLAFDWTPYIRAILKLEGLPRAPAAINNRRQKTIRRITQLLRCDLTRAAPLMGNGRASYDVIVSNLCIEAVANDYAEWQQIMQNVIPLLRPGGHLILCGVKDAYAYPIGDKVFEVLAINESHIQRFLQENGFIRDTIHTTLIPATHPLYPYAGLMGIIAQKEA